MVQNRISSSLRFPAVKKRRKEVAAEKREERAIPAKMSPSSVRPSFHTKKAAQIPPKKAATGLGKKLGPKATAAAAPAVDPAATPKR
jgi:hypothetical protein